MGAIKKLSRAFRADKGRLRNIRLSRELTVWYATHPLSPWQQMKVNEVRADYEEKQKGLDQAHDIASSEMSDVYMQFELDYLNASHAFREKNPGEEYHEPGFAGIASRIKNVINSFRDHATS